MYFCLYCLSSKEESVCTAMEGLLERFPDIEHTVWFPKKEVSEKRRGVTSKVEKPMFPNYLFVFWGGKESAFPFFEIRRIPGVVRFLGYDDGSFALKGKDLAFAEWIHMYGGVIKQSKVILREGQNVHISEGPLRGFDGNIVKIDRHHKRITLQFDIAGNISRVSFSVDFITENARGEG